MLAHVQAHVRGVRGIKGGIRRSRIKCSDPLIPLIPREGSPEADTHMMHIPVICVLYRYDIRSSACTRINLNKIDIWGQSKNSLVGILPRQSFYSDPEFFALVPGDVGCMMQKSATGSLRLKTISET